MAGRRGLCAGSRDNLEKGGSGCGESFRGQTRLVLILKDEEPSLREDGLDWRQKQGLRMLFLFGRFQTLEEPLRTADPLPGPRMLTGL